MLMKMLWPQRDMLSNECPLQNTKRVDFSWNQLADPKFVFHDYSLLETVKEGNPEAQAFFRLLALCHTVMSEEKKEGKSLTIICGLQQAATFS